MTGSPGLGRRVGTVLRWPAGIAFTSWHYLWRTTALHRVDEDGLADGAAEPEVATGVDEGLQRSRDGFGPLFHRRYRVTIEHPAMAAEELMDRLQRNPGRPAPSGVAVFWKVRGEQPLRVGDEFVVRMPGPWDGPVRVVDMTPASFRLATLRGHLEAGQIEFRARDTGSALEFTIESWTRSGDRVSELLYSRVRLIKEMQLHMWAHYCEHVPKVCGGRVAGGLHIHTRRGSGAAAA